MAQNMCRTGCGEVVKDGSVYCQEHSCTTCNKLVMNTNNHKCRIHTCKIVDCDGIVEGGHNKQLYCDMIHRCSFIDENNIKCHKSRSSLWGKTSKFCNTHTCGYFDCNELVINRQFCLKHTCTFENCGESIDNDYVDTCIRHYCRKYNGCDATSDYCIAHMCTGECGFSRTMPDILGDDIYAEVGCPVHSCSNCHNNRLPEYFGKEFGYCKKCKRKSKGIMPTVIQKKC